MTEPFWFGSQIPAKNSVTAVSHDVRLDRAALRRGHLVLGAIGKPCAQSVRKVCNPDSVVGVAFCRRLSDAVCDASESLRSL
jgi:hypothetical protein